LSMTSSFKLPISKYSWKFHLLEKRNKPFWA